MILQGKYVIWKTQEGTKISGKLCPMQRLTSGEEQWVWKALEGEDKVLEKVTVCTGKLWNANAVDLENSGRQTWHLETNMGLESSGSRKCGLKTMESKWGFK